MIYGYARVSTAGQSKDGNSLEDQTKALQAYGCQEIIMEQRPFRLFRLFRLFR